MNKLMTGPRWLTLLGAALVLGALNFSIVGKERIKRHGDVVYLRLAPVDPRSLMQGDYMALRFALVPALDKAVAGSAREGEVRLADVSVGADRVAVLADTTAPATLKLRYRIRNGQVWLGTNAFFFQEGDAERFSGARYGEFRVDGASGEAVLVGLRDSALKPL
ncbi:MAG: GDYXXLXY domain-containing protein [Burkholderiales bacterium]|nr:GDYXXLXY domain-containing protein [Burkholderiales bacterium]